VSTEKHEHAQHVLQIREWDSFNGLLSCERREWQERVTEKKAKKATSNSSATLMIKVTKVHITNAFLD
jgi:hypothetical protein